MVEFTLTGGELTLKHVPLALAFALLATSAASAQVSIMVRDDRTAVLHKVNEPDTYASVQAQAAKIGGPWRVLARNDTTCGGGAIWYASNGAARKYFLVTGKETASQANLEGNYIRN